MTKENEEFFSPLTPGGKERIAKTVEAITPEQIESSKERVQEVINKLEQNYEQLKEVCRNQIKMEEETFMAVGVIPNDVASKSLKQQVEKLGNQLQEYKKALKELEELDK